MTTDHHDPTTTARRPESHTKTLLRKLVEPNVVYMHRAEQPFGSDLNIDQLLISFYAGLAAILLARLADQVPEHVAEETAAEVEDLMDMDEVLWEQVWHEAEKRGIDPEKLIEAAEVRRIEREAKKGESR